MWNFEEVNKCCLLSFVFVCVQGKTLMLLYKLWVEKSFMYDCDHGFRQSEILN